METTETDLKPFQVKDCTLITRMGGMGTAMNLRELRERIAGAPQEVLFHHFAETTIRPSFDDPEFRNDLAVWAARDLREPVLAEQLGIINPYKYPDFEDLRRHLLDIIDERLSELHHIPWVPQGQEFHFMQAVTVVFDTDTVLESAKDLITEMPRFTFSSIYFHFVEARRRTADGRDDFTSWLLDLDDPPMELVETLDKIDFYFLTLRELKEELVQITAPLAEKPKVNKRATKKKKNGGAQ